MSGANHASALALAKLPERIRGYGHVKLANVATAKAQQPDLLLLPHDRSMPTTALLLRGPDVLTRLPVACTGASPPAPGACQVTGPGELFHRLGGSLNVR